MIILAALSFWLNVVEVAVNPNGTFYSPLTRAWELLSGGLLAWYSLSDHEYLPVPLQSRTLSVALAKLQMSGNLKDIVSFSGLITIGCGLLAINEDFAFPGFWAVVPVLGSVLIIAAGPSAWVNRRILSSRAFVWIGLISFPLYLWHWPILSFGRILHLNAAPRTFGVSAIIVAIIFAWLTLTLIERPLRFSTQRPALKLGLLSLSVCFVGVLGIVVGKADLTASHTLERLAVPRLKAQAVGSSLSWYRGKENWLFLGNNFNECVAKLTLAVVPAAEDLDEVDALFSSLTSSASKFGTKVAVIIGPNKESVYPEYLPPSVEPSVQKYSRSFFDRIRSIPNIIFYDPTFDLISHKKSDGLLYWRTDTHWNAKGAFIAFFGLLSSLKLPVPEVEFVQGEAHSGDLLSISKLEEFPLRSDDNWEPVFHKESALQISKVENAKETAFGSVEVVENANAISNLRVWVIGDSFTTALRPYLNATFKRVNYMGHWSDTLRTLPSNLEDAGEKPDLIIVIRVERSF